MIKIKISQFAQSRGLRSAYALQKALKISPTIAARLWRGNFDKLGMGTLDKLCAFFDCQPQDFLEFQREGFTQTSNTQLSNKITQTSNRVTQSGNITQTGNTQLSNESATQLSKIEGELISTKQIAAITGLRPRTVRDLFKFGKLPRVKKGEHNYARKEDLEVYLAERAAKGL